MTFFFVSVGCVVVVKIVEKIDAAVEMVEEAATYGFSQYELVGQEEFNTPNPNLLLKNFNGPIKGLLKIFSNHVKR